MKKAPQRPKSRFGNQAYYRSKRKFGQKYWRKGAYSRPGHPPFHNGQVFNIRNSIVYKPVSPAVGSGGLGSMGAKSHAYRVGPMYRPSRRHIPVPQLHEYGGKVRLNKRKLGFESKGLQFKRRPVGDVLRYPRRPYMAPASKEARKSARAKHGGSLKWLLMLGGMKGRRI